jgi:hypothetical protein
LIYEGASKKNVQFFLTQLSEYNGDDISKHFYQYPEELEGGGWITWLLRNPVFRFILALFFQYIFICGAIRFVAYQGCFREVPNKQLLDRRFENAFLSGVTSFPQAVISTLSFSQYDYLSNTTEGLAEWHDRWDAIIGDAGLSGTDLKSLVAYKKEVNDRVKENGENLFCKFNGFVTNEILICLNPRSYAEAHGCLYFATNYFSYVIGHITRTDTNLFLELVMKNDSLFNRYSLALAVGWSLGYNIVHTYFLKQDLRYSYLYIIGKYATFFFVFEFMADYTVNQYLLYIEEPQAVNRNNLQRVGNNLEGEGSQPGSQSAVRRRAGSAAGVRSPSSGGAGGGSGARGGGGPSGDFTLNDSASRLNALINSINR